MLGNFVNRILKFCEARFEGVVPGGGEPGELERKLHADVSARVGELTRLMEAIELRKSAQELRALWVVGNEYLTEAAPWSVIKTDVDRAAVIVRTAVNLVAVFARLSAPIIPFTAEAIATAVGATLADGWPGADAEHELTGIPAGREVRAPGILFNKLEDAEVAAWRIRFSGDE